MRLHLESCPACRFQAAQAAKELEELKDVWGGGLESVIVLRPRSEDTLTDITSVTTLAAQGNDRPRESASVTLTSDDQRLMLHAVRDARTREIWLYLKADDPDTCRNVLVTPFGGDRELLTDESGRINLGEIEWPQPERLTAEVRLPRATFRLSRVDQLADRGSSSELESPSGDRIKVTFTGEGRYRKLTVQLLELAGTRGDAPLRVAIRTPDSGHISGVPGATPAEVSFDRVSAEGIVEIYLYR
ncbi:MAG: hypothetical protein AB1772_00640 [Candidatus Zixiibacteriota bacterium]